MIIRAIIAMFAVTILMPFFVSMLTVPGDELTDVNLLCLCLIGCTLLLVATFLRTEGGK